VPDHGAPEPFEVSAPALPAFRSPAPGEIALWLVDLAASDDRNGTVGRWLSEEERDRAARFQFERDRRAYALSRSALRAVLAASLGLKPDRLELVYGLQGKPHLAPHHGSGELHFNLSHSGTWALIALARGAAVGVDVEHIRPVNEFAQIAERFFAPTERAAIERHRADQQLRAFFRVWTRKEACLKATGRGLWVDLHRFGVPDDQSDWAVVDVPGGPDAGAGDAKVAVRGFTPFVDYEAAVAVEAVHERFAVTCRPLLLPD